MTMLEARKRIDVEAGGGRASRIRIESRDGGFHERCFRDRVIDGGRRKIIVKQLLVRSPEMRWLLRYPGRQRTAWRTRADGEPHTEK